MSWPNRIYEEFEAWVSTHDHDQRHGAQGKSKVYEEDQDERAKDAMILATRVVDAYRFCWVSLKISAGKGLLTLPEGRLFGEFSY